MPLGDQTLKLATLAKSRDTADRERLLMAVVDMCEGVQASSPQEVAAAQGVLGDLFISLIMEAEAEVRRRLAERIADTEWAPLALINLLSLDEIEIARPVIAASPLLRDNDLLRLLRESGVDHQIEVARRPGIGAPVVDAIVEVCNPQVLTALAGNETAEIQAEAMARLIEESRKAPALRSPLARHPRLTSDMAEKLYAWVGESLKTAIVARFRIDAAALDAAIAQTVEDLSHSAAGAAVLPAARTKDREAMERRLVDKLHEAGQLRSGYLLRALRERKLSLFEAALAKLSGLTLEDVRRTTHGDRPEWLALASMTAGIDRSVFPSVLSLVRQLNAGLPSGGPEGARRAADMFTTYSVQTAAIALRQTLDGV